jgi:hypothetical protein
VAVWNGPRELLDTHGGGRTPPFCLVLDRMVLPGFASWVPGGCGGVGIWRDALYRTNQSSDFFCLTGPSGTVVWPIMTVGFGPPRVGQPGNPHPFRRSHVPGGRLILSLVGGRGINVAAAGPSSLLLGRHPPYFRGVLRLRPIKEEEETAEIGGGSKRPAAPNPEETLTSH